MMAPFANRIHDGRYDFNGRSHQLFKNWDETETRMTRNGEHVWSESLEFAEQKDAELTSDLCSFN